MLRAVVLRGLVGLASVPVSAEVTCFTHVEIEVRLEPIPAAGPGALVDRAPFPTGL